MQIITIPFSHYRQIFIRWLHIILTDTRWARCTYCEQHQWGSWREEILVNIMKNINTCSNKSQIWGLKWLFLVVFSVTSLWPDIFPPSQLQELDHWGPRHCILFHQAERLCVYAAAHFTPIHSPPEGNNMQRQFNTLCRSTRAHTLPSWSFWQ